jgi:hypothetical protein
MTPEFKKIYSIANGLANLVRTEKGNALISINKMIEFFKKDHFSELLLSKTINTPEKLKAVLITYFILNRTSVSKEELERVVSDLYMTEIDLYEDKENIEEECSECEGSGNEECYRCEGTGKDDCNTCDGHGLIDCDTCDGTGTDDCFYCDGKGSETEEDDEGDEIDVECVHCDGEGTQGCKDCGGEGNFECPICEGNGNDDCDHCDGYGNNSCGECDGSGNVRTTNERYNVRRSYVLTLGDEFSKYEDVYLPVDEFNEIESDDELIPFNFEIYVRYYDDDGEYEDRRKIVGMDDDFVEVVSCVKLENFTYNIGF